MAYRWTEDEYQRFLQQTGRAADFLASAAQPRAARRHRYNAKRTAVEPGISFPSKLQAKHYGQLQLYQRAGEIVYFTWEVPLRLPGGVKHVVDWLVIVRPGQPYLWADTKGKDLTDGRAKRKQVRALAGIEIRLWTDDVEI